MKHPFLSCVLSLSVLMGSLLSLPAQAKHNTDEDFFKEVATQSQELVADLNARVKVERPLLVTTTQDLDDLSKSQSLGRLIGELVSSSLSAKGYAVHEVRMGQNLRVGDEGEHILTRDYQKLRSSTSADYAVVSTYTKTFTKVYITLKAVRLNDGLVIASRSFIASPPRIF